MYILKPNTPHVQVPNSVIYDKRLSWKAKGLFAYILAKPEDWDFSSKRMADECDDGVESTRNGVKELIDKEFLQRTKLPNGRVVYRLVYEGSIEEEPKPSFAVLGTLEAKTQKAHSAKTPLCDSAAHKKERSIQRKINTNKEDKPESSISFLDPISDDFVDELYKQFEISKVKIRSECQKSVDWLRANGKVKKDYKSFLRYWIRDKHPERPPKEIIKPVIADEIPPDDPALKELIQNLKQKLSIGELT